MKNKYVVIDEKGAIHSPEIYVKSESCPSEFKIIIEREALGISVVPGVQSKYIDIAKKFGFKWEPNSDIGFMQYDHNGQLMMELVQRYARQLVQKIGFPIYEVRGSNFFDMAHPVVQAYAKLFGDRLFQYKAEKKELVMSYDASYPQFNLAAEYRIKEDQLPFAHFSLSDCYRNEQSGECMLLLRQRRFFMPDLHPYFKDVAQAFAWYPKIEEQILSSAKVVNRQYWNIIKVSSEENWEKYQAEIVAIAKRKRQPALVEIRREGVDRYWIIDVDYSLVDEMQQVREIGCIQIDVGNAKRLGIKYLGNDGAEHHPVIIHAAVPGGIERYIYAMLDNPKVHLPLWVRPVQVRLLPVSEKYAEFCEEIAREFPVLRIEIDDRSEGVSKKIKNCFKDFISEFIVVGEKEVESVESVQAKLDELKGKAEGYPSIEINIPVLMSRKFISARCFSS